MEKKRKVKEGWCRRREERKKGIFLSSISTYFRSNFILGQTLPVLKKDRKIFLRSDSTVFRSNFTFLDEFILSKKYFFKFSLDQFHFRSKSL